MRIGLLCNPELVNVNYRAHQPLGSLARRGGHEVIRNTAERPLSLRELLRCDAVLVHRMADEATRSAVDRVREAGVGIVWDNDDDLTAIPSWNPTYHRLGPTGRRQRVAAIQEMVRVADVVTTPSAVLARQFREIGAADVRVLENYLPPAFVHVRRRAHDGVVIACAAALEHQADYERLRIREVLSALLDAHPHVRVLNLGLGLGLDRSRSEHVRLTPFYELVDVLAQADVGIAPLIDIPWNRARSNVKLKEYAAAALPWLASPVGPYLGMGEKQGGRLVSDDDWYAALERLVIDVRGRRKLARRAARWAKGELIDKHAHRWEQALQDAAGRGAARRSAGRTLASA